MSRSRVSRALTERQQFWLEHLRRCEAQRLSIRAYAQTNDVSATAMRSAKRDLARKLGKATDSTEGQSLTLIPVMTHTVARSRGPAMQVYFPGGVHVEVSADAAGEVSDALLRAALDVGR